MSSTNASPTPGTPLEHERPKWRRHHWLAALPTIVLLAGIPFVNRVRPTVFGFPLLVAWIVIWVVAISAVMGLIFHLDRSPAPRQ